MGPAIRVVADFALRLGDSGPLLRAPTAHPALSVGLGVRTDTGGGSRFFTAHPLLAATHSRRRFPLSTRRGTLGAAARHRPFGPGQVWTIRRWRGCGLQSLFAAGATWLRFEDASERIAGLLDAMTAAGKERGEEGFWDAQAGLCSILSHLLRSDPAAAANTRRYLDAALSGPSGAVRSVREYLQAHLGEAISLVELARHAGVSLSTLSHHYRRETGETPMQTLVQMRLHQVKGLLLRGLPLKEIAPLAGFVDAFHLSRVFKRMTGVSPRQFRNQV